MENLTQGGGVTNRYSCPRRTTVIRNDMEFQVMMLPPNDDASRPIPLPVRPAQGAREGLDGNGALLSPLPENLEIKTPEEAIQALRALSREALTLREGLGRLLEGELSGAPSARRHLRFGQAAIEHAAAVFELLAALLESD